MNLDIEATHYSRDLFFNRSTSHDRMLGLDQEPYLGISSNRCELLKGDRSATALFLARDGIRAIDDLHRLQLCTRDFGDRCLLLRQSREVAVMPTESDSIRGQTDITLETVSTLFDGG